MLRNMSNNTMQLQITTTALQIERPNGDLPRNYPFSCALQKETDNDKSRLVQMLALLRCRSASSCQSNKSQREGRREVDRKNRSRGQFYAEVEKEGGREGEVELEIGFL